MLMNFSCSGNSLIHAVSGAVTGGIAYKMDHGTYQKNVCLDVPLFDIVMKRIDDFFYDMPLLKNDLIEVVKKTPDYVWNKNHFSVVLSLVFPLVLNIQDKSIHEYTGWILNAACAFLGHAIVYVLTRKYIGFSVCNSPTAFSDEINACNQKAFSLFSSYKVFSFFLNHIFKDIADNRYRNAPFAGSSYAKMQEEIRQYRNECKRTYDNYCIAKEQYDGNKNNTRNVFNKKINLVETFLRRLNADIDFKQIVAINSDFEFEYKDIGKIESNYNLLVNFLKQQECVYINFNGIVSNINNYNNYFLKSPYKYTDLIDWLVAILATAEYKEYVILKKAYIEDVRILHTYHSQINALYDLLIGRSQIDLFDDKNKINEIAQYMKMQYLRVSELMNAVGVYNDIINKRKYIDLQIEKNNNKYLILKDYSADKKYKNIYDDTIENIQSLSRQYAEELGYEGIQFECLKQYISYNQHIFNLIEVLNTKYKAVIKSDFYLWIKKNNYNIFKNDILKDNFLGIVSSIAIKYDQLQKYKNHQISHEVLNQLTMLSHDCQWLDECAQVFLSRQKLNNEFISFIKDMDASIQPSNLDKDLQSILSYKTWEELKNNFSLKQFSYHNSTIAIKLKKIKSEWNFDCIKKISLLPYKKVQRDLEKEFSSLIVHAIEHIDFYSILCSDNELHYIENLKNFNKGIDNIHEYNKKYCEYQLLLKNDSLFLRNHKVGRQYNDKVENIIRECSSLYDIENSYVMHSVLLNRDSYARLEKQYLEYQNTRYNIYKVIALEKIKTMRRMVTEEYENYSDELKEEHREKYEKQQLEYDNQLNIIQNHHTTSSELQEIIKKYN